MLIYKRIKTTITQPLRTDTYTSTAVAVVAVMLLAVAPIEHVPIGPVLPGMAPAHRLHVPTAF